MWHDTDRNAYLRDLYQRSPSYRLMILNLQRKHTGRPPLTLETMPPPRRPYGGRS